MKHDSEYICCIHKRHSQVVGPAAAQCVRERGYSQNWRHESDQRSLLALQAALSTLRYTANITEVRVVGVLYGIKDGGTITRPCRPLVKPRGMMVVLPY